MAIPVLAMHEHMKSTIMAASTGGKKCRKSVGVCEKKWEAKRKKDDEL